MIFEVLYQQLKSFENVWFAGAVIVSIVHPENYFKVFVHGVSQKTEMYFKLAVC